MKKNIIIGVLAVVILAGVGYQIYVDNQFKKAIQTDQTALAFLASADANGVTGFDKMVVQTINKINQAQQSAATSKPAAPAPVPQATTAQPTTPAKK